MKQTWIVTADGAKAQIYSYQGPSQPLKAIDYLSHINEPSRELVTNDRGRMLDKSPGQRSAFERPTDPHEHEKFVFARELVDFLVDHLDSVDRLVIAASPKVLGYLRQLLPQQVKVKIFAELDKDLTNIPHQELPKHFQDILNIEEHPRNLPNDVRYAKP